MVRLPDDSPYRRPPRRPVRVWSSPLIENSVIEPFETFADVLSAFHALVNGDLLVAIRKVRRENEEEQRARTAKLQRQQARRRRKRRGKVA